MIGKTLGHYRIVAKLGAGGMGEVYRARDTRLERDVAIKVLPSHLADDPNALARFEREAKAIAALSHPNILGIFDVGREGGIAYAVTELLEGETLRDRLAGGGLPVRKAVDMAIQIAQALAAAHEKGIVHRDLKPENIFVTADGRTKILDFGLAKVLKIEGVELPGSSDGISQSPTITVASTQVGTILGTVGYMAPEQIRGLAIDPRTDIFALGAVLYEMLAGRRAFQRDTAAETLTAILREDPPEWGRAGTDIPPGLQRIVQRCLEKNAAERFQSARDVAFGLEALSGGGPLIQQPSSPFTVRPATRRLWLAVASFGVLLGFAAGFYLTRERGRTDSPRFQRLTFQRGHVTSARFMPDGQTVVYGAMWEDKPIRLFSRRLESPESAPLSLPPGDILAVSHSGELAVSIGRRYTEHFISRGRLAQAALAGGAPREILESAQEADWMPDGTRLLVVIDLGDKYRLQLSSGEVLYETAGWISHARLSPAGDLAAFIDHPFRGADNGAVALLSVSAKQPKKTLTGDFASLQGLAWAPDGREIWFTGAQSGWNSELRAVSPAGRERVVLRTPGRLMLHDVSAGGRALLGSENIRVQTMFGPTAGGDDLDLSLFDSSFGMGLSDDGETVLIAEQGEATGAAGGVIYLRRSDGSPAVRLGDGFVGALAPNQLWVATFDYRSPSTINILPTGPGQPRQASTGSVQATHVGWFPDSRWITLIGTEPQGRLQVYAVDLAGGQPKPLTPEGFGSPMFNNPISPDAKKLATTGPGRQVFLCPLDGGKPRLLESLQPGDLPIRFSADGRILYCSRPGNATAEILRCDMERPRFEVFRQVRLRDPAGAISLFPIDITPDGAHYIYGYMRILSDLYLVDGLR
jgi:Tol biopolymer transport system component